MCGRARQSHASAVQGRNELNNAGNEKSDRGGDGGNGNSDYTNPRVLHDNLPPIPERNPQDYKVDNTNLSIGQMAVILHSATPNFTAQESCLHTPPPTISHSFAYFGFCPPGTSANPIPLRNAGRFYKASMSNARTEELAPSYARCLEGGRTCVLPCNGYYEWLSETKQEGGGKQPYYVYHKRDDDDNDDKSPMFLAAFYRDTRTGINDEYIRTFSLLTKASEDTPKKRMTWLHSRTPLIMDVNMARKWLLEGTAGFGGMRKMVTMGVGFVNESEIAWHPVDKKMSKAGVVDPDCHVKIKLEREKMKSISSFFSSENSSSSSSSSTLFKSSSPRSPSTSATKRKATTEKVKPSALNFFAPKKQKK